MLIEVLGLFQGEVKIFFQVLQYFSRFLLQNPLFFQVFQVWTYFSRFSMCGGNPEYDVLAKNQNARRRSFATHSLCGTCSSSGRAKSFGVSLHGAAGSIGLEHQTLLAVAHSSELPELIT